MPWYSCVTLREMKGTKAIAVCEESVKWVMTMVVVVSEGGEESRQSDRLGIKGRREKKRWRAAAAAAGRQSMQGGCLDKVVLQAGQSQRERGSRCFALCLAFKQCLCVCFSHAFSDSSIKQYQAASSSNWQEKEVGTVRRPPIRTSLFCAHPAT